MKDITKQLRATEADPRELTSLLMMELGQATYATKTRIDLPDSENVTMRIHYTKAGNISRVESILDAAALQRVRDRIDVLLQPGVARTAVAVMFANVPMESWWGSEILNLRAAPANAPRAPFLMADHPFLMELPFESTGDGHFDTLRVRRLQDEYSLLLSLFLPGVRAEPSTARQLWATIINTPTTPAGLAPLQPYWVQRMYSYEGFQRLIDKPLPQGALPDMPLIGDSEYYSDRGIRIDDVLSGPRSLGPWLSKYQTLGHAKKATLQRAAYWLAHARHVWSTSQSATLVALVQAIEALLPSVSRSRCETCGQMVGDGPTKQFSDFVQHHGGVTAEDLPIAKLLYQRRSQLTHGHQLLLADKDFRFGWTLPADAEEDMRIRYATTLVRGCVVNWFDSL